MILCVPFQTSVLLFYLPLLCLPLFLSLRIPPYFFYFWQRSTYLLCLFPELYEFYINLNLIMVFHLVALNFPWSITSPTFWWVLIPAMFTVIFLKGLVLNVILYFSDRNLKKPGPRLKGQPHYNVGCGSSPLSTGYILDFPWLSETTSSRITYI